MSAISITIKIKGLKWVGDFSERDCCEGEVLLISLNFLFSLVKSTTKVQQTQFSLDECGTTAISSTAVEYAALRELVQPRELHFTANRPFLYYISDGFGNVCFIGQYCGGKR